MKMRSYEKSVIALLIILILVTLATMVPTLVDILTLPNFNYVQVYTVGGEIIEDEISDYRLVGNHMIYLHLVGGEQLLVDIDNVTLLTIR